MSLRKSTPESFQKLGRRVYVTAGQFSLGMRATPDFILVGAQRCGTTSLFRALMEHPGIVRPTLHKGVNYFDLNYHRGNRWYQSHFPLVRSARRATAGEPRPVVFEASGYYMYHPFAIERMARELPTVKLVVMLRDPVERAYSAYQHERARGYEWEDFETALSLEEDRLLGEVDRMRHDPAYESFTHRHHSYLSRGHYADQLETIYRNFSRDRVHVMDSEAFFTDPNKEFRELSAFLDLGPAPSMQFKRYNERPRNPMLQSTRQSLEAYYHCHNTRLASLLGRPLFWMTSKGSPTMSRPSR